VAQLKKIVPSNPVSSFSQVAPEGGAGFKLLADGLTELYDRLEPAAKDEMAERGSEYGREMARKDMGGTSDPVFSSRSAEPAPEGWDEIRQGIFDGESGGDFNALFGYANRPGGEFEDVQLTNMTVDEALEFSAPSGQYGQSVKNQIGRVATPMGAFQVVGTTLRAAKDGLGLTGSERMDEATQERIGRWIYETQGTDAWVGYKGPRPARDPVFSTSGGGETTKIRTAEGKLEGRKYSPFAGPILQAHDAAAKVAYQAEVLNKSTGDIMSISSQFLTDPDGFAEAAREYVDGIVESAPDFMKASVRGVLEKEVSRRHLGVMDAKQREIRQRASNESDALMDRWSANLQEAIVSGDPYEVMEAQERLDDLLQARERLPGLAWTQAQSANVFLDIERKSGAEMAKRQKEALDGFGDDFRLITETAKRGQFADAEDLLNNPEAVAAHPELAQEAAAFVALRDNLPEFLAMKPSEQIDAIERMAAAPVKSELQLDVLDAAKKIVSDNVKAWNDDPVKQAFDVGDRTMMGPPPELPELTVDNPETFIKGLAARREHMNMLIDEGFTSTRAYLSQEEAQTIGAMMGKETPAEIRAAMAGAIVAGFGEDAVTVFGEINADKVTAFAGKMMALGGNPAVAAQIFQGQAIIDEGLVQLPSENARIDAFNLQVSTALQGVPDRLSVEGEILAAARAIYAVNAKGIEYTSEAASELMGQAVQTALGQSTNKRGETTGGVQPILGHQTLLPVGVSGVQVDDALKRALGAEQSRSDPVSGLMSRMTQIGRSITGQEAPDTSDVWDSVGGPPLFNGKPLPKRLVESGAIRIVPYQGLYRMEITSGNTTLPAEDKDGNIFFFDLQSLMEATP
jgi:hypothetical protein